MLLIMLLNCPVGTVLPGTTERLKPGGLDEPHVYQRMRGK